MRKKVLMLQFTICPLLYALWLLSALLFALCQSVFAQRSE
jgi:hypothetical protein